ncbi:nuclear transport factor 2 family protein [Streptomyces sp. Tue6028]|uniref:nuclear transport factor 2 family protein n=1 Tax=Streptomyces sp. Tue6028 TaxID=2036037 RepID=UPI003D7648C1
MDSVALLGEYAEIKNQHDVAGMLARTHPDCQYEEVGSGREVTGRAALRHSHENLFAAVPDYTATLEGITGAGDTAVAWGRFRGTLARPLFGRGRAGDPLEAAAMFVCTFRDGLLYRERAYVDLLSLRGQLASPAQQFLDTFTAAWSQPSGATLSALFTQDATIQHPGMREPVHGRPAIHAYFDRVLAARPGLVLRPTATAVEGDTVFVHYRMQAVSAGSTVSWEGIDMFRLRGALAENGVAHFDPATTESARVAS